MGAVVAALDECDDGPEQLADRQVVPGQLGTGDDHHGGDFQDEITDVVEGAEQVVLDTLDVQVLLHSRVVGIGDIGLIEPLDEDCTLYEN